MKAVLSFCIVVLTFLSGVSVQAQETLLGYDNFNRTFLDPDKWFGTQSVDPGVVLLESVRQIQNKQLNMLTRIYGKTDSNDGFSYASNQLRFSNAEGITAIEATVTIEDYEAIGCGSNTYPTQARVRLTGYFFNTGTPTSGSAKNDVTAYIVVRRFSNSTDPLNVLEVIYVVVHCDKDDYCSDGSVLDFKKLGSVKLGQKVEIKVAWDQPNHGFIFQKDREPEVFSPYPYNPATFDDTAPPGACYGGGCKRLEVGTTIPNCTTEPRPVAFMNAFIDDVFVNE